MDLRVIFACITSIICGFVIGYPVLFAMRKLKARQNILSYVDIHKGKSGTPTIGGLIFILPTIISSLAFAHEVTMVIVAVGVMVAYGIIGFLDDFIKISHHENQGLKAYQKIIGQSGIALIVSLYCYYGSEMGSVLYLPFTNLSVDIDYWIIPLVFLLFIATTNAVNLLDGLDGLCTGVSSVSFLTLAVVCIIMSLGYGYYGNTILQGNANGLAVFSLAVLGGLLVFICFNGYPAKIFMGDTGSLALGGAMACVFAFSGQLLLIFLLGVMLIVTCLSVILQVGYFKLTHGKRIWLMSPLHHHFQYKGVHENRIVAVYTVITVLMGLVSLISVLRGIYV